MWENVKKKKLIENMIWTMKDKGMKNMRHDTNNVKENKRIIGCMI